MQGRRKFPAAVLQRQLNDQHPAAAGSGGGDFGGGAGSSSVGLGGPGSTKSALSSVRRGQLRAGVVSKRAMLRFMSKRGPLPSSLVRTSVGGGGGGATTEADDASGDASASAPASAAAGPSSSSSNQGSGDLFQFYRLLLPSLDDERGRYHLKETLLAKALCKAAGRDPKHDPGAQRVLNWQRDSSGTSAGSLANVAADNLVSLFVLF